MKGKIIPILIVIVVLCGVASAIAAASASKEGEKASIYSNAYFTLSYPANWNYQEENTIVSFYAQDSKIAEIEVFTEFEYGDSAEQIVANVFGTHSSLKSESVFSTDGGDELQKVIIATELSASWEIQEYDAFPDETHYFYLSGENIFIDIKVCDDEYLPQIENALKTFTLPIAQ